MSKNKKAGRKGPKNEKVIEYLSTEGFVLMDTWMYHKLDAMCGRLTASRICMEDKFEMLCDWIEQQDLHTVQTGPWMLTMFCHPYTICCEHGRWVVVGHSEDSTDWPPEWKC